MEKFLNNIFNKKKREQAGRAALVAGMIGVAASEGLAANTETKMNTAPNAEKMSINYENPARPEMAAVTKDAFSFEETKKKEEVGGGDPEGEGSFGIGEGVPITLTSAYFKTGTVEYRSAEARENAKNDIRSFLKTVDLKNSKVIVTGYSSKERPTDLNLTLAQKRTEEGVALVKEVLAEDYPGQDIQIEFVVASDASVYDGLNDEEIAEIEKIKASSPEEFQKLINEKEAIGIDAVTVNPPPIPEFIPEKIPTDLRAYGGVLIDESASMNNDVAKVKSELLQIRAEGKEIKTVVIEGGTTEAHLRTLENFLTKLQVPKEGMKILLLTDEPDNATAAKNYETNIGYVLGKARDKKVQIIVKIYNPDPKKDDFKLFVLNDPKNRNILRAPVGYTEGVPQQEWYNSLKVSN